MKNGRVINIVKQEFLLKKQAAETAAADLYDSALENPEYLAIKKEMAALNFAAAKGELDSDAFSKKEEELSRREKALLKRLRLSAEAFAPEALCHLCNDTGFIEGKFCDCFKRRYYEVLYDILGLERIPALTFENADFNAIHDEKQRTYLKKLYDVFEKYTEKFPKVNTLNALIFGGTGVGKSRLMFSVANRMASRGFGVIYISATQLVKLMLEFHTSPVNERGIYLDDILGCDMLIIDDLGSEQRLKNVTEEYLLQILNTRETAGKPVFVTSNLSIDELNDTYNERLFSRLVNKHNTILKEIKGVDLRLS